MDGMISQTDSGKEPKFYNYTNDLKHLLIAEEYSKQVTEIWINVLEYCFRIGVNRYIIKISVYIITVLLVKFQAIRQESILFLVYRV